MIVLRVNYEFSPCVGGRVRSSTPCSLDALMNERDALRSHAGLPTGIRLANVIVPGGTGCLTMGPGVSARHERLASAFSRCA